jgi:hypothetical protein
MNIDLKNLPASPELLRKIIFDLHTSLHIEKDKYARLLEEFKIAKQQRFSPSSEKNTLQSDLFDEAGIELTEEALDLV